jgi:lipopolysaccharide transport system ATP-binding protein
VKEAARSAPVEESEDGPEGRLAEPAGGSPPRLGSGEVRITAITAVGSSGGVDSVAVAGEPITFRIAYTAVAPLDDVVFGLGFLHESGVFTAGPNSGGSGRWSLAPGRGQVEFHVDSLLLQPGEFSITGAVVARGHTYDYGERLAELRVRSTGDNEPGLVRMPGVWKHLPQPNLVL